MQTSVTSGIVGAQGQQATTGHDAFNDLNLDAFIKMLVAELQNQDPLNPMNNTEILQQVSQIRAIESNQRLTETLQSVMLGQNVNTASSLLGRTITGLTDDSKKITGVVDRVSIEDNVPRLHLGDQSIQLKNVAEILPDQGG